MVRYRIKALAEERGMPITVLARLAQLDQSRVYNIANNKVENVTMNTLEALAKALGVRVRDLLAEDGEEEHETQQVAS
jgi:DNA-binding Xre family transcriptional regulator